MTDAASQTNTSANGAANEQPRESIDQVRDLLFGSQMKMVDTRLQNLDDRLLTEASALRSDLDRRITDLTGSMKAEFARYSERLDAERATRVDDLKALGAEIRDSLRNLERRHQTFEEAAGQADAELRDHLLKQGAAFTSDLAKASDRLSAELDRITARLQSEKLDVSALTVGLTDLADRLGATPREVKPTANG